MSWKFDIQISNEILRKAAAFATRRDTRIAVFGGVMNIGEWRDVLAMLLDEDAEETDPTRLRDALDARIGKSVTLPKTLEFGFADMVANAVSRDLCRHLGVDPLRLAVVAGIFSRGTTKDGDRSVTVKCSGRIRKDPPKAAITIRLDERVTWSSGRFTVRHTNVPQTVLHGMKGMGVDRVVEHAWEGWKSLKVTKAGINDDATIIGTDASDAKRTEPLAA